MCSKPTQPISRELAGRIKWYATHATKPRHIDDIPQDRQSLALWRSLPYYGSHTKLFPPHKQHIRACKQLGVKPQPKHQLGVPQSIAHNLLTQSMPASYKLIYSTLYRSSHYEAKWHMRICETSIGQLSQLSGLSPRTICRALSRLRSGWYIRLIWRGRPDPQGIRYTHSCYELPYNYQHIQSWRINRGRKRCAQT